MWYPDSTDTRRRRNAGAGCAVVLACSLLAGGCATSGGDAAVEVSEGDTAVQVDPAVRTDYRQAVALLEAGDLEGAEAVLQRFVSAHSDFPGAWTNLAIIYRQTDRAGQAEAALERALAANGAYAPALNQLGVLHREAGRFAEAEAAYLKAVTAQPEYPLAHFNLGVLNDLYLGSPETALTHYERYQALTSGGDEMVAMWIVDIRRRLGLETRSARAE